MSFNVATLEALQAEGLDLAACIRVLSTVEPKSDTTAERRRAWDRERKAEKRGEAKSGGMSGGNPPDPAPNEIGNLTPTREGKTEAKASSKNVEPQPWSLPVGVSLQVWTDLKANRKRKRLSNTPTAWKTFSDDLKRVSSQTGIPPPQLIEQCTAKGWGSIHDPREDNGHGRTNGLGRHQPDDGLSPTTRAAISVFGPPDAGHQRRVPQ